MKIHLFYIRDTLIPTIINIFIAIAIVYNQTSNGIIEPPFSDFKSAIISIFPGNFMPLLIISIVGTLLTRKAVNAEVIPSYSSRFPYTNFLLRGISIAVIVSIIIIPVTAFLFSQFLSTVNSREIMITVLALDAMVLGLIICPLNIWVEQNTRRKEEYSVKNNQI